MIDEKKCYFFGRNKDQCEFVIDHASCSRVHAVLIWHKHLNRSFLIDLNSSKKNSEEKIRTNYKVSQFIKINSARNFHRKSSTRTK